MVVFKNFHQKVNTSYTGEILEMIFTNLFILWVSHLMVLEMCL